MKHLLFSIISSLIILSLFSCKKEFLDVRFSIDETELDFTIDTTSVVGDLIYVQNKYINLDSVVKANNSSISKVKKVRINKLKFEIVLPTGSNFDSFTKGSIVISTPGLNNDLKIVDFTESDIIKNQNSFEIIPTDNNVLTYFRQKQMTITCNLTSNKPIVNKMELKVLLFTDLVANPVN